MKKTLRSVTFALLLLLIPIGAAACKNNGDPNVGKWNAVTITALGLTVDIDAAFQYGASLDLKANGKCTVTIDGDSATGEWSAVDGILTISVKDDSYTAYIEDGILVMSMPDLALDVNFERQ